MAAEKTLTSGPIAGQLTALAVPLLACNIFQQLYNTADTFIIGRWVGDAAFGAAGVAGTVMNLFLFLLSGACAGVSVLFSQLYGAGDLAGFRREFFQAAAFGGGFTLALSLLALGLLAPLLEVIRTPPEMMDYARDYLGVIFAGLIAAFAYNLCAAALRAVGDTLAALAFLGVSVAVNIGLDLLFVAVFRWGIAGAAGATVLSQALAAALSVVYVRLRHPRLFFRREDVRADRALLRDTLRYASASALHQSSLYIGKLLVQGAVNTMGPAAVNAYTATMRIEGFANSFGDSGAEAISVFVGQNTGAGDARRTRRGFSTGMRLMLALGAVMSVLLFSTAELFSRLLLPGGGGEQLAQSVAYLQLIACFYPLCFIGCTFVGLFRGSGRVKLPVQGTLIQMTVRVALSWLLARRMGLSAVALATGLGWCAVVSFQLIMYLLRVRGREVPRRADVNGEGGVC